MTSGSGCQASSTLFYLAILAVSISMIYKFVFAILLIFFSDFAIAVPGFEDLPPRMWKATMPNPSDGSRTTIYLLGITHMGLPSEYDDYFRRDVLPAFLSADTFSFEGAGGREKEDYLACDSSVLDDASRKTIDAKRAELLKIVMKVVEKNHRLAEAQGIHDGTTRMERTRAMHTVITNSDEYELIELQNVYAGSWDYDQAVAGKIPVTISPMAMRGSVVDALRRQRPTLTVRDIDSRFGIRRAYCGLGKERIYFLNSQFDSVDLSSKKLIEKFPVMHNSLARILSTGENLPSGLFGSSPIDKTFLCQRNREWLSDMQATLDGKVHFFAVGVSHLFKVNHDDAHCRGLLGDLDDAGWHIEQIEKTNFK